MATIEGYNMPDELYYEAEHAWARVEDDGTVTVGMDEFYAKNTGDVLSIDLPDEGDEVEQGETCGKIQSAKWIGKIHSPVAGEILEINEELEGNSTLINTDPYGEGWIMKIQPSNLDDDLANLIHGDRVEEWLKGEIERLEREKKE
jgi:glycine cleavage system H protein